jgi:hypothetical protein
LGDDPFVVWVWWAAGASASLVAAGAAVFLWGMHPALLLGWAVAMIVAAVLVIFRKAQ